MKIHSRTRGFTMVELLVGVIVSLISVAAIVKVMMAAEGFRRSSVSGSAAQVNGSLALNAVAKDIQNSGYGFASSPAVIGCSLQNRYNGVSTDALPQALVPIQITTGSGSAADSIRILASNAESGSIPILITAPGYVPGDALVTSTTTTGVHANTSAANGSSAITGDLMVLAKSSANPCQIFQATSLPTVSQVGKAATSSWNSSSFPDQTYPDGSLLINMGTISDVTYSVSNGSLMKTFLSIGSDGSPSYQTTPVFNNVVQFKALYGKDTNADGKVDTWDSTTPTTNAGWLQVLAVRVAVVTQSDQMEKNDVTFSDPTVDMGATDTFTAGSTCGSNKCLVLSVSGVTNWRKYRFKVFDSTVALRNMLWTT